MNWDMNKPKELEYSLLYPVYDFEFMELGLKSKNRFQLCMHLTLPCVTSNPPSVAHSKQ